jgi:hypothetical protein
MRYVTKTMLRRNSLEEALTELERGSLPGTVRISVNRSWWNGLPRRVQTDYQSRCETLRVRLVADEQMSTHFVEVSRESREDPPLSSEHPI